MLLNPETFMADLDRASEAAARSDYRDAERWTGLAERKLAVMRKLFDVAEKVAAKRAPEPREPEAPPAS